MEGGFQEIDVDSGAVLFEWYSLNHVDILDTVIQPNTSDVSGTGTTGTSGFDYFHINSVDKSLTTGNYLVSSRHTGTLFCVNASVRCPLLLPLHIWWLTSRVGPERALAPELRWPFRLYSSRLQLQLPARRQMGERQRRCERHLPFR